jgi:hypothetical protein
VLAGGFALATFVLAFEWVRVPDPSVAWLLLPAMSAFGALSATAFFGAMRATGTTQPL